jgi:hypothetical protein
MAAVVVLATEERTVVREVVIVVGRVVGAGVETATATAAGWSGASDVYRFSLATIVMPPKLLSVMAVASVRSMTVDVMSGLRARRGRSVMPSR